MIKEALLWRAGVPVDGYFIERCYKLMTYSWRVSVVGEGVVAATALIGGLWTKRFTPGMWHR